MKILLIGDAKELYLLSFARHLKVADPSLELHVLDTNPLKIPPQLNREGIFTKLYSYEAPYPNLAGKLLRRWKRYRLQRNLKNTRFDRYIAFGMWVPVCYWLDTITRPEDKLIGMLLGSDFFKREQRPDKERFNKMLRRVNSLATSNPAIIARLEAEQHEPARLHQLQLGLAPMEALSQWQQRPAAEAKKQLGIDPSTLVICCGYNASPNQQHQALIQALQTAKMLPPEHLLLVPLSYGGTTAYKKAVTDALLASGLRYRIIEEYLSPEAMARVWKSVDVFIQLQQSDCLSGSMMENLYCGNIVITGSWLPYQVLKDRGTRFFEVDKIADLGAKLDELLPQRETLKHELNANADKFEDSFWKKNIQAWVELINKI